MKRKYQLSGKSGPISDRLTIKISSQRKSVLVLPVQLSVIFSHAVRKNPRLHLQYFLSTVSVTLFKGHSVHSVFPNLSLK